MRRRTAGACPPLVECDSVLQVTEASESVLICGVEVRRRTGGFTGAGVPVRRWLEGSFRELDFGPLRD